MNSKNVLRNCLLSKIDIIDSLKRRCELLLTHIRFRIKNVSATIRNSSYFKPSKQDNVYLVQRPSSRYVVNTSSSLYERRGPHGRFFEAIHYQI